MKQIKKRKYEKRNGAIDVLLPLLQVSAQQEDAGQIMNKAPGNSQMTSSLSATISLSITEKNGSVRNRTISMIPKAFLKGGKRDPSKFLDPADVEVRQLLIYDNKSSADEMWIYLRLLKKNASIVSF